jgi:hypothetical protein
MPAETHQHGRTADTETVPMLLCALLSDEDDVAEDAVLSDLGVDIASLISLWSAVCEEFAERPVGPELDPADLDPQMTVAEAAEAMAALLAHTDIESEDDDE